MGWLKDVWQGFGDIVDASARANKGMVLKGFIGAMPIYGKRGPSVFLPEEDEDDRLRKEAEERQFEAEEDQRRASR